jgi:hypothetical protein
VKSTKTYFLHEVQLKPAEFNAEDKPQKRHAGSNGQRALDEEIRGAKVPVRAEVRRVMFMMAFVNQLVQVFVHVEQAVARVKDEIHNHAKEGVVSDKVQEVELGLLEFFLVVGELVIMLNIKTALTRSNASVLYCLVRGKQTKNKFTALKFRHND